MFAEHAPWWCCYDSCVGLLDRVAMNAERRRLEPFFFADERFIQTDLCELVGAEFRPEGTRLAGGQVAFSLTNKAVYFRRTKGEPEAIRIPYERIVAVLAPTGFLEFTTSTGGDYLFRDIGRAMGDDKFVVITSELRRRELHRQTVSLPDGSQVEFVYRALDEDRIPEWVTVGGFDRDDTANRAAIAEALAGAISRFGPIGWLS